MNMISFDRTNSALKIDQMGQTIIADTWFFNRFSNAMNEIQNDNQLDRVLASDYVVGDSAFERRKRAIGDIAKLSIAWEASIKFKWNDIVNNNSYRRGMLMGIDIRVITLKQFQNRCRGNANTAGNLIDEISGMELSPDNWSVDRCVNGIVFGVSGCYHDSQMLITHQRINDFKEGGGRKIFASIETLDLEKQRLGIAEDDQCRATVLNLRCYLDPIRLFRASHHYRVNMDRLGDARV